MKKLPAVKEVRDQARTLIREKMLSTNSDPNSESEAITRLGVALSAGEAILKHADFETLAKSANAAFAWSACNVLRELFQLGEDSLAQHAPAEAVVGRPVPRSAAPASLSRAQISAIPPSAQSRFFAAGGKIK